MNTIEAMRRAIEFVLVAKHYCTATAYMRETAKEVEAALREAIDREEVRPLAGEREELIKKLQETDFEAIESVLQ